MSETLALVTGACGFVGSHMVDYLLSLGYKVRATDLAQAPKVYLNEKAEFIPADLTKKEEVYPLLRDVEVIFHIAAIFDYTASAKILFKVNVGGTKNLLKAAKDFPKIKRIIIWSTGAIYSRGSSFSSEEDPLKPTNNYERSKLAQEKVSFWLAKKYALPITIIRPASIYGPRSQYGLAIGIKTLVKSKIVPILGKSKRYGAYVYVLDVVRAAEFLLRTPEAIGQIYNIVDDSKCTPENFVGKICKNLPNHKIFLKVPYFMVSLAIDLVERIAKRAKKRPILERDLIEYVHSPFQMSNQKIKSLGFEFTYPDLESGLKETVNWYRKEGVIK